MNFGKAFFCGLAFYLAKDVYDFITELGSRVIYRRYGDKIEAYRKEWHEKIHKEEIDNETTIGFRA